MELKVPKYWLGRESEDPSCAAPASGLPGSRDAADGSHLLQFRLLSSEDQTDSLVASMV